MVPISTIPPEKFPGLSGVKDFTVTIFSNTPVGNKSILNDFLSGSALGSSTPLRCVLEYLSPNPLTKTYFPPTTDAPVTLVIASAALLLPLLVINSSLMASLILFDLCLNFNKDASLFSSILAVTITSSVSTDSGANVKSNFTVSPGFTFTPVTDNFEYPTIEAIKV